MGIRVIKTAVAAVTAVYIASFFQLDFYLAAGLLAIMGVDITRKRSLNNAATRIAASLFGLLIGSGLFYVFGTSPWVIGLFICSAYPLMARAKLKDGIVTSSVIVFHVYTIGEVSLSVLLNECWLLLIGLGCATFFNLIYMPKPDKQIIRQRHTIEELLSIIFQQIARHLRDSSYVWNGEQLIAVEQEIARGIQMCERMSENTLFKSEEMYRPVYFLMRKQQMESIHRMIDLVAQVYMVLPHGQVTAEVFECLSEDVKCDVYSGHAEEKLMELERLFRGMPLPATRAEFELRSAILQLTVELKHYLSLAKKRKKQA